MPKHFVGVREKTEAYGQDQPSAREPLVTTLTSRGQTVIPSEIRSTYGLEEGIKLRWVADKDTIRVIPLLADPIRGLRGALKGSGLHEDFLASRKDERSGEQGHK